MQSDFIDRVEWVITEYVYIQAPRKVYLGLTPGSDVNEPKGRS